MINHPPAGVYLLAASRAAIRQRIPFRNKWPCSLRILIQAHSSVNACLAGTLSIIKLNGDFMNCRSGWLL
ncbi:hypothetical protein I7I53_08799 [Histoplasma capsulatum var. duboisii H88]|uniref:Uncharacterized protein n=1 Tax=Ajellomyces capsulatus (strain H88) TaxID=544711 RepID=A0A8A1L3S8_AJEC8|nr:hypothetical protein I7I53_08799 [Histoplasma capsulatum var. duboisii H88]